MYLWQMGSNMKIHTIAYCTLTLLFTHLSTSSIAQESVGINDTIKVNACIEANGDTIPCSWLQPVYVQAHLTERWRKFHAEWTRLRNAVYVTYPYAKAASKTINEINAELIHINDKKQRKAIIHSREKLLKSQFADKLTKLSVYQGKVLMKLINRESGNNCYEIIDEYKGSFNAAFWQSIAFLFGSSLKQTYQPLGNDQAMELIVKDVEKMYGYR